MLFAIGQRWLSESENALGLGIITALDQRTVTIYFPAADETRIYAAAQAPLSRIVFSKGETLSHQSGWQGEILDVQNMNGLLFYLVKIHKMKMSLCKNVIFRRLFLLAKRKIVCFQRKLIAAVILHCVIARFVISKHNLNRHCVVYAERVQV